MACTQVSGFVPVIDRVCVAQKLIPKAYWPLITDPGSPIRDAYPESFKSDLNGKKNEWEAVVLIPFIDQQRLLAAMAPRNNMITEEERARNRTAPVRSPCLGIASTDAKPCRSYIQRSRHTAEFGVDLVFTFNPDLHYTFPSPLPEYFPDLQDCNAYVQIFQTPVPPPDKGFRQGLLPGARLGVNGTTGLTENERT